MNFLLHLFSSNKQTGFDNIQGYDDIKNIVRGALDSYENYTSCGHASSAQTYSTMQLIFNLPDP